MANLSKGNVRDVLARFGIADDPVAVLAISGADGSNDVGVYDDQFYISVGGEVHCYRGNVDPSSQATGRATLVPMRVFHWRAGIHGLSKPKARQYAAFVQAEMVTVSRFRQGADTGWFGINHHRGGVNGTSSLGCQTYPPDLWPEAKQRLYEAIRASDREVSRGDRSGKPFPYVVVPLDRAKAMIAGGAAPKTSPAPKPPVSALWTIRLKGGPGEPDEVYDKAINIAGRLFVPVRDFCVAALDCTADSAPLQWIDGPGDTDVLKIDGKPVEEVSEIGDRAYVWVVEAAGALGYDVQVNAAAKNLVLTRKG